MQSNTTQREQCAQWNAPSSSCIPALPSSLTCATCTHSRAWVCAVPQLPRDRQDCVCHRQYRTKGMGHVHCRFSPHPVPVKTHPGWSDTGAALNDVGVRSFWLVSKHASAKAPRWLHHRSRAAENLFHGEHLSTTGTPESKPTPCLTLQIHKESSTWAAITLTLLFQQRGNPGNSLTSNYRDAVPERLSNRAGRRPINTFSTYTLRLLQVFQALIRSFFLAPSSSLCTKDKAHAAPARCWQRIFSHPTVTSGELVCNFTIKQLTAEVIKERTSDIDPVYLNFS